MKPVPNPDDYDKVGIDPKTKRITREGIPTVINPVDKNALEAALQLKKEFGGKVSVLSMAPPSATENLREALAMGADEAYLMSDMAFGGADTLATSYSLAKGIEKIGPFDMVLCGAESADGATAQVASQLGETLGVPHLWNVFALEAKGDKRFGVKTKVENGSMEWELTLPCLLGVARELNVPRFISAIGIIKAKNKPLTVWGRADFDTMDDVKLGLKGSPTQAGDIFTPDMKRKSEQIAGDAEAVADEIISRLKALGIRVEGGAGA